jgi:hypothetical protein
MKDRPEILGGFNEHEWKSSGTAKPGKISFVFNL